MKVNFAIVAKNAFTDSDGRLSIIQVIETIRTASFPAIHPELVVVSRIKLDSKKAVSQSTEIVHSDSGQILVKSEPADMEVSQKKGIQFISTFIGLRFNKPGIYHINIKINQKKLLKVTEFVVCKYALEKEGK